MNSFPLYLEYFTWGMIFLPMIAYLVGFLTGKYQKKIAQYLAKKKNDLLVTHKMKETMTLKQAVKQYDSGSPIWSIEMGGLGPGYEQGIQLSCFEIIKKLKFIAPKGNQATINKRLDDALSIVDKRHNIGHSGASAGASMWLAYKFMKTGYAETINTAPKNRLIQVDNNSIHKSKATSGRQLR